MKKILKVITFFVILLTIACEKEAEPTPVISGKWIIQEEAQYSYINGIESNSDINENAAKDDFIVFNLNGTAQRAENGRFLEISLFFFEQIICHVSDAAGE